MSEDSLQNLLKNLNYKIKYDEISQASWGGRKSFKAPSFSSSSSNKPNLNPSLDYLLNSASQLDNQQKARQRMFDEYKKKQEQPIEIDGQQYKFHNLPAPTIPDKLTIIDLRPDGRETEVELSNDDIKRFLSQKEQATQGYISELNQEEDVIKKNIKDIILDNNNNKNKLDVLTQNFNDISTFLRNLPTDTPERQIDDIKDQRQNIRRQRFNLIQEIKINERRIKETENELQSQLNYKNKALQQFDQNIMKMASHLQSSKDTANNYADELKKLNKGNFSTERREGETDEEYIERLNTMADIPYENDINYGLAVLDQKRDLEQNLKEITRDNQIINQVLNSLSSLDDGEIFFRFNKIFPRFKELFLKKYGYDNKNIKFEDILYLFTSLIKASDELRLVAVNPQNINDEDLFGEEDEFPLYQDIYNLSSSSSVSPTSNPLLKEKEVLVGISPNVSKINKRQPVIANIIDNSTLKIKKIDPDTGAPYDGNINTIYLRYKLNPFEAVNYDTGKTNKITKNDVLYSTSGDEGDFKSLGSFATNEPVEKIMQILNLDLQSVFDIFNITRRASKAEIAQQIISLLQREGIQPSTHQTFIISKNPIIVGEGLSHTKKDKKVKFGDIVIMPNKLFYDNILSISRPDGVKMNGFKNRHVSDDFVVCVIKMLENRNDYQKELNNLSSTEKVLLDNLLKIANLHKKVITGSGNESIKKLKNDLQILEGEIQAGNNNESLKKKLHDILHKLAYFKVISLSQANKHYKEYINNFF
jgi:hypothetical protein